MTGNTKLLRDSGIAPKFADRIDSYGEDFYKTVKPNAETVLNWAVSKYSPYFVNKLKFDHKPTADEVLKKLDEIIENEQNLTVDERKSILIMAEHYKYTKLKNANDVQSMSNLIAYKINKYDTYMFWHELRAVGVNSGESYRRSNKHIEDFFVEWMSLINPINFENKNL